MKEKRFRSGQGRSQKQIESNEKVAFMAYGCMLIGFTALMFGLLLDKLIG